MLEIRFWILAKRFRSQAAEPVDMEMLHRHEIDISSPENEQ
jgi:hypothetical protein